jgi:hypothetical protein
VKQSPSFERINYSVRTNKQIERRMIFDRLRSLEPSLALGGHRYLGLGSMWFVDFILAHKVLSTNSMWSIEVDSWERARFNKPYACIEVKAGTVSAVFAEMTQKEWAVPTIAWLDYDGVFDADVRHDCQTYLTKASSGSILLLSVNANRSYYQVRTKENVAVKVAETLTGLFGSSLQWSPSKANPDIPKNAFEKVLRNTVLSFLGHTVVRSGRGQNGKADVWIPLFDFFHSDGADMVTVGGLLASAEQAKVLATQLNTSETALIAGKALHVGALDLQPMTTKEKITLDALLPCDATELPGRLAASGLKIPLAEARKYRTLYPHFPVFAELVL